MHRRSLPLWILPLTACLACRSGTSDAEQKQQNLIEAIETLGEETPDPVAAVETRPTLQGERHFAFDDAIGAPALPDGWRVEATNPGPSAALWRITADETAPSAPGALCLVDPNGATGQTYNLCWNEDLHAGDLSLEVAVRSGSGVEDQGGGPAWRIQDADNYYVARWNPLEDNFRVYFVYEGRRGQLASADVDLDPDTWHTIRIEHRGALIRCWLDDELLLRVSDTSHLTPGGVGLWTKADAATAFDDLHVVGG